MSSPFQTPGGGNDEEGRQDQPPPLSEPEDNFFHGDPQEEDLFDTLPDRPQTRTRNQPSSTERVTRFGETVTNILRGGYTPRGGGTTRDQPQGLDDYAQIMITDILQRMDRMDARENASREEIRRLRSDLSARTAELQTTQRDLQALQIAPTTATSANPTVIAAITDFRRSPYDRNAPFNLDTKAGFQLFEAAQKGVHPQYDGKPTSLLPWLNALLQDVRKFHLGDALKMPMGNPGTPEVKDILTDYGSITEADMQAFFTDDRVAQVRGVNDDGSTYDDGLLGANPAARLMKAKEIQNAKIIFYKIKASITPTYSKQILHKFSSFHEDGTKLIAYLIQDSLNTTSAAMRNALTDLNTLSFKKFSYDIGKLHAGFDTLVATLAAGGTDIDKSQQIMYLLQAYETCDGNQQWTSHVYNLRSQVNINNMDVERVKESAKSYVEDLKRGNRWKKDPVSNTTAFPTQPGSQSQQGANATSWKYDKSVSSGNTYTRNNETYRWCTGPGHNNRPMWVKHVPGQCVPQVPRSAGGRSGRGGVHAATPAAAPVPSGTKGRKDISKTKAMKEMKALFADNELDANELSKKIADLMFE